MVDITSTRKEYNMHIIVDELPTSCVGCKCFAEHRRPCNLELCIEWNEVKFKFNDCPLKILHDHDKELITKVFEKVSKELEHETGKYGEMRQCTSPHYQGDYVWFNYVKFRKLAEKLQKEVEK